MIRKIDLEIDEETNVAYLSMREIEPGEAKIQLIAAPDLVIDMSDTGEVLGIEFLNAHVQLSDISPHDA